MPRAKANTEAEAPAEDHRKPYQVIAEGVRYNGKEMPIDAEVRLSPGQAKTLLAAELVREVVK